MAEAVFPCERCAAVHANPSGFCENCSGGGGLVSPALVKRLGLARKRVQLLMITLAMSFLESSDKALLGALAASAACICCFYVFIVTQSSARFHSRNMMRKETENLLTTFENEDSIVKHVFDTKVKARGML